MSNPTDSDLAARSCGRCTYWKQDAGECRYGPPCCDGDGKWPKTGIDDWCFKWKSGATSVRESQITTEIILNEIATGMQMNGKEWVVRSDAITGIAMDFSSYGFTKAAIFSRMKTLVKYGQIGMGRFPPGATEEQPSDCIWSLVSKKSEEPEEYVEPAPPGRPRLYTADTIVSYLRQHHGSPMNRIGIRPLHRAIILSTPMSMGTCQKLVAEALALGLIQRHDTGYWAPAQNPEHSDFDA
jgi:hypothetical protein